MFRFIRKLANGREVWRDDRTGIAETRGLHMGQDWPDGLHPNIDRTGSVLGMKRGGYWGEKDRVVTCGGYKYDIDRIVFCDDAIDTEALMEECMCVACCERRAKERQEASHDGGRED